MACDKVGAAVGLILLAICAAAIGARFVQDQPAWSAERMKPSMEKIDPLKGFGRVFGRAAFANFTKSLFKLVIVGAKDPATPPAAGEEIARQINGAKLVSLDAAHISNVEQPAKYTETVLGFLKQ